MAVVPLTIDETLGWIGKDGHVISEICFDGSKMKKIRTSLKGTEGCDFVVLVFYIVQKFEILFLVLSLDFFAFCWTLPSNCSKSLHQVIFELNAIPTCTSSCRLRAGETEVLIALKCPISQLEWEIRKQS